MHLLLFYYQNIPEYGRLKVGCIRQQRERNEHEDRYRNEQK